MRERKKPKRKTQEADPILRIMKRGYKKFEEARKLRAKLKEINK